MVIKGRDETCQKVNTVVKMWQIKHIIQQVTGVFFIYVKKKRYFCKIKNKRAH